MITITRNLARQIRAVFRSAGFKQASGHAEARLLFAADTSGLAVSGLSGDGRLGLKYQQAGEFDAEQFVVPLECLAACEGKRNDPVTLETAGENLIVARWTQRNVPQSEEYQTSASPPRPELPPLPESTVDNPPELLMALRDASQSADDLSTRYALSHLQLRGESGQIVATDGSQLLVQSGFEFDWTDEVLIPSSGLFGCRELPKEARVQVGRTPTHVVLTIGAWTVFLRIDDKGRYPNTLELLRSPQTASSDLHLGSTDLACLRDTLPHLPTSNLLHSPVTLDLNGQVILRGKSITQSEPTELVLTNSRLSGEPIRATTCRWFLERAVQLGFDRLYFFGPEAPVQCDDGRRQYLWVLLKSERPLPASANAVRIESPRSEATAPTDGSRRAGHSSVSTSGTCGQTRRRAERPCKPAATAPAAPPGSALAIDEAIALQSDLRAVLGRTKLLIAALRRERRQTRLLRSTLTSLRQLQAAAS